MSAIIMHSRNKVLNRQNYIYFGDVSFKMSGTTVHNATYMKPPDVKGSIHDTWSPEQWKTITQLEPRNQ